MCYMLGAPNIIEADKQCTKAHSATDNDQLRAAVSPQSATMYRHPNPEVSASSYQPGMTVRSRDQQLDRDTLRLAAGLSVPADCLAQWLSLFRLLTVVEVITAFSGFERLCVSNSSLKLKQNRCLLQERLKRYQYSDR